ncbi:hypothetical protein PQX77_014279 [Marasmius sp. AFHP31]|nr:hypothetical protein PQX77_014279 [Marasmius sp. AFHP31]
MTDSPVREQKSSTSDSAKELHTTGEEESHQKLEFARSEDTQLSQWTTNRTELWSYYLYYVGNNGLSGFNFGPSQFQNLLFLAGYDPSAPPFTLPCGEGACVLPFLGEVRDSE